jgi:hypothetical protein
VSARPEKVRLKNDGPSLEVEVLRFEYMKSAQYADEIGVIFNAPSGAEACLYLGLTKVDRLREPEVLEVVDGDPPSYRMLGRPRLRFQKRKKTNGTGYVIDGDLVGAGGGSSSIPEAPANLEPASPERRAGRGGFHLPTPRSRNAPALERRQSFASGDSAARQCYATRFVDATRAGPPPVEGRWAGR